MERTLSLIYALRRPILALLACYCLRWRSSFLSSIYIFLTYFLYNIYLSLAYSFFLFCSRMDVLLIFLDITALFWNIHGCRFFYSLFYLFLFLVDRLLRTLLYPRWAGICGAFFLSFFFLLLLCLVSNGVLTFHVRLYLRTWVL